MIEKNMQNFTHAATVLCHQAVLTYHWAARSFL